MSKVGQRACAKVPATSGSGGRILFRVNARIRAWLERRDLTLLLGLFAVALLGVTFLALAELVSEGRVATIDRAILLACRRDALGLQPVGPAWLASAAVDLTALGSSTVATLIVVVAFGFLLLAKRPRVAALVVAACAGAGVAISLLKAFYDRGRPDVTRMIVPAEGLSFPSGHATIGTALYLTLGVLIAGSLERRALRVYVVAVSAALALAIGLSRVYIGVHYPSDVLAGWTLGLGWALFCGLVERALQRRGAVERGGLDDARPG
jgi:undecaprenyl-diphosphatase